MSGMVSNATHLAIVGAGPAGLGAAIAARASGIRVTVIDDQLEPGGQIWRSAASAAPGHAARIGKEYEFGRRKVAEFLSCGAEYLPGHTLWQIEMEGERPVLYCGGSEGARTLRPDLLLLATGALERPVPVPGWTLPGVMTAGGLQILLKSAQLCPERAVLAGAGPLLWLLATQMIAAGRPPLAVVECIGPSNYFGATRHFGGALRNFAPLKKGLGLIAKVMMAGVPIHRGARDLHIEGDGRVTALRFRDWIGRERRVAAEIVGLHGGVVPNQQASRLLRLAHGWSEAQQAFLPERGADLRVAERIYLAGDGARIGGADVAWMEGQLIGRRLGGEETEDLERGLAKAEAIRPFIDRLYKTPRHLRRPSDETVLCRCEAVTAGRVRQVVRDGAMGPNQVKFMLRTGMGPCQGRVCGLAVAEVVAESLGKDMSEAGYFRIRPPLKPMPFGVIAGMLDEEPVVPVEGTMEAEPAHREAV